MPLSVKADGQTIDETWFNEIKSELEAADAEQTLLGAGLSLQFKLLGDYSAESSYTGLLYHRITQDITITSALLLIIAAGTSGSTQADVKFKRGGGGWTSLFTTKPAVPYTAGSLVHSNNGTGATVAVLDSLYDELLVGDLLRFDLTAVQPNAAGLLLALNYGVTGAM